MNTFQRAGAAIGLSLAVGTAAYAAEKIFENDVDPSMIAEQYKICDEISDERTRNECVSDVDDHLTPVTWLGVVQLGSIVTSIGAGVVAYRHAPYKS